MQLFESFGSVQLYLILVACLLLIIFAVNTYKSWWKDFPPGPIGLPFLGYVPALTVDMHVKLAKMSQKYGDVFSLRIGNVVWVVLSSGKVLREVLGKTELSDRPQQEVFCIIPMNDSLLGNGLAWKEHKKFAMKLFKDLNAGKAMEQQMIDKVKEFVAVLSDQKGKTYDCRECLFSTINGIIIAVAYGKNGLTDSEKKQIDSVVKGMIKFIGNAVILLLFPGLKQFSICRKLLKVEEFAKLNDQATQLLRKKVQDVKKDQQEDCFVGQYIKQMSLDRISNETTTFSEELLVGALKGLFGTGVETIRDSLVWAMYILAVHEDVQLKVQNEIDEVIGRERTPTFADQKDMKYTQAVIMEAQRWKPIVPIGSRVVTSDMNIGKYFIPKGTAVIVNHWAVFHDPRCWDDPEKFMPERFLSKDGKHILKNDSYLPFSYGKRSCTGELVAVMEMFLFFTHVLQKFHLKLPEGEKPNFEGFGTISYQMKKHKLRFIPRDN